MFEKKTDANQAGRFPDLAFSSGVIFGAAHGIGKAIQEALLRQKIPLLLSIDRDSSFTDLGVTNSESGTYRLRADITDIHALRKAVQGIRSASLEIAVFSAGIQKDEDPALTHAVNVDGIKNCFEVAAPLLKPGALAIFLSSDLITFSAPENGQALSPYVASKRAVAEFAESIAATRPDIRVLILLPGPVETKLFLEGKSEELLAKIEEEVGILSSAECAHLVLQEIVPQFATRPSGSAVRVYKKSGVEWLERFS
jgi:3-oxoacyl-[acyl-carrier protein] reductase